MKRLVAAMLAAFLFLFSGCAPRANQPPVQMRVVTSFYPLYIMALNITQGINGVQVDNMAGQQAGCLHDYQLQSKDMKNIEQADVFVINGAGMESFLDKVTAQLPDLHILDSSTGIELLHAEEDHHGHEHDGEDAEDANPHMWVSITNCIRQVENIADGLAQADPERAAQYRENAQLYMAKLSALRGKMHEQLDAAPHRDIITFHEAFPYFAQEFNLHIASVVNREPDSQPSARELAQTIRLIESTGIRAVFAEPQYSQSAADIIARESGAAVYTLDPAVTGPEDPNAYLEAMERNLQVLLQALFA